MRQPVPIIAALIGASITAIGGGIVSGILVHWLPRSRDQEAWARNCEREEWKELFMMLGKMEHFTITLAGVYRRGTPEEKIQELDRLGVLFEEVHVLLHSKFSVQAPLEKFRLIRQT
jgi:hypothetical protein